MDTGIYTSYYIKMNTGPPAPDLSQKKPSVWSILRAQARQQARGVMVRSCGVVIRQSQRTPTARPHTSLGKDGSGGTWGAGVFQPPFQRSRCESYYLGLPWTFPGLLRAKRDDHGTSEIEGEGVWRCVRSSEAPLPKRTRRGDFPRGSCTSREFTHRNPGKASAIRRAQSQSQSPGRATTAAANPASVGNGGGGRHVGNCARAPANSDPKESTGPRKLGHGHIPWKVGISGFVDRPQLWCVLGTPRRCALALHAWQPRRDALDKESIDIRSCSTEDATGTCRSLPSLPHLQCLSRAQRATITAQGCVALCDLSRQTI